MRLSELRSAMSAFATRFDAGLVSATEATDVLENAAAIENMAAAVKAMAAARVAETPLWRRRGDRSPAHHVARCTGTTVGQASDAIATARRLSALPATAAAARRGEISAQQAAVISDAALAAPESEARLLQRSRTASFGELRDECARIKAASCPDLEARRRRIHEQRSVRVWNDLDGSANLKLHDNPEVVAGIMATLIPIRDELYRAARAEGRSEALEAHAADALAELARRADTGIAGKPCRQAKILVRVDLPSLLRGYPTGEETCELVGYGPVAVSALRDMMESGDPFLAAIVTKGEQVLGVAHLGRKFTAHQQSALEFLYPTCAVEGCDAVAFLENDHREDWAKSHITLLDLADRPCWHHHDLKTREGWAFVEGTGKRAFVPPDDPRHPKNAHAPPAAA